jgi:hypothetical protein
MQFGPGDQLKNLSGGSSDDGRVLALQLTTVSCDQLTVTLAKSEVSKILAFIMEQAAQSAAKRAPEPTEWRKVNTKPIAVNEIAVAPGRADTEAYLTVQAGVFQMTFSAQLGTLLDALRNLEAMTVKRHTHRPSQISLARLKRDRVHSEFSLFC